jgi:hypothetical protein
MRKIFHLSCLPRPRPGAHVSGGGCSLYGMPPRDPVDSLMTQSCIQMARMLFPPCDSLWNL